MKVIADVVPWVHWCQDQLKQIGFEVDFQAIDFNTLLDIMDAQTFDAIVLGWRNGYPDDPARPRFSPPRVMWFRAAATICPIAILKSTS